MSGEILTVNQYRSFYHFPANYPLKRQGIGDAFIQPYSGHESRQSLEVYSKLSLKDAQREYAEAMKKFPI